MSDKRTKDDEILVVKRNGIVKIGVQSKEDLFKLAVTINEMILNIDGLRLMLHMINISNEKPSSISKSFKFDGTKEGAKETEKLFEDLIPVEKDELCDILKKHLKKKDE